MCKFLAFTFCMSLELRPWHVFVQFVCFSLKSKMLNIFLLHSDLSFNQSNTQGYWNIYIQRLMDKNVENMWLLCSFCTLQSFSLTLEYFHYCTLVQSVLSPFLLSQLSSDWLSQWHHKDPKVEKNDPKHTV